MNAKTRAPLPDWLQEVLQRLDDELVLRGYARQTRSLYSAHVRRFYAGKAEADRVATDEQVRGWMLSMLRSGLSRSYANQALSALRFLHRYVLHAPAPVAAVPRPKREKKLPKVLSQQEARRFPEELGSPKYRAIAFVLYSAGLRVGEVARLRVEDIDSGRGRIHVRQGKGRKDRYAILSPLVLEVLREYVRAERTEYWLFQ
jgi:integrase